MTPPIYPFDSNGRPHVKSETRDSEYKKAGSVLAKHHAQSVLQAIVNSGDALRETKALFAQYQAKTLSAGAFDVAVKALGQRLDIEEFLKKAGNDLWSAVSKALIKEFSGKNSWKY